jgi:hypothetical protein
VQAPKRRTEPRESRGADRRLLFAGVAAVVVVAAAVAGYFLFGLGESAAAVLRDAGCEVDRQPAMGRQHVERVREDFEYNTDPPTTGPHHPQWAPYDVYPEPVEQLRLIHNLEHGGIVIQYGDDVPQGTLDQMVEWYRDDPNGIVIASLPRLGDEIALEAWVTEDVAEGASPRPGEGIVAKCTRFDENAFDTFKEEFGFRGPERFPREELQPGT